MITSHLIIRDNEQTICRALESLLPLGGKILVADVGCRDSTYRKCKKYGAELIKLSLEDDYSKVRNDMILHSQTGWQFYLDPWEILVAGHDEIKAIFMKDPCAFQVQCVQGDIMTKQIRLWHKGTRLQFENPFYESITGKATDIEAIILGENVDRCKEASDIITKWKNKMPLATEPYYYHACNLLTMRKWDEFLKIADHYLFHEKKALMPVTLTRYYCAMVQCYIKKDYPSALRNILNCLAVKPLMAEFWCLLGDVYYAQKNYEKAKTMYENAILLGSRRLRSDDWPTEIPKYDSYPEKMIEGCKKIVGSSSILASYRNQSSPSTTR